MKYNILHIGCHNGNDDIYSFVSKNIENIGSVVLVDANPICIENAKKQYDGISNCTFECFAVLPVSIDGKSIDLHSPVGEEMSTVSSVIKDFVTTHSKDLNTDTFKAKTTTLKELLLKYPETNYLSVDTEGLDVLNLFSLDPKDYDNIKKVVFEFIHSDGTVSFGGSKLQSLLYYFGQLGFKKCYQEEFNIHCEK